jgi:hypothetical protein
MAQKKSIIKTLIEGATRKETTDAQSILMLRCAADLIATLQRGK